MIELSKTNIKVEFRIIGDDYSPDEITSKIGIIPSSKFQKGDKYVRNKKEAIYKYSCWTISTDYEESFDVSLQIDKIISILYPQKNSLVKLKNQYKIEYMLEAVINIENGETPGMYIKSDIIKFLNDIHAELDLDLYILS